MLCKKFLWLQITLLLWHERNNINTTIWKTTNSRTLPRLTNKYSSLKKLLHGPQLPRSILGKYGHYPTSTHEACNKETRLRQLEIARELYDREQKSSGGGQTRMTQHFQPHTGTVPIINDRRNLFVDPGWSPRGGPDCGVPQWSFCTPEFTSAVKNFRAQHLSLCVWGAI